MSTQFRLTGTLCQIRSYGRKKAAPHLILSGSCSPTQPPSSAKRDMCRELCPRKPLGLVELDAQGSYKATGLGIALLLLGPSPLFLRSFPRLF